MKSWLLIPLVTVAFGGTKEKTPSLIGRWTLVETAAGTGYNYITTTYAPSSELCLAFSADGTLSLSGANPGRANSQLWKFNWYEVLPDNRIRLFNTQNGDETKIGFILGNDLSIWYEWARCGHQEKFVRP